MTPAEATPHVVATLTAFTTGDHELVELAIAEIASLPPEDVATVFYSLAGLAAGAIYALGALTGIPPAVYVQTVALTMGPAA